MRSVKISDFLNVVKPEYVFIRIKPNNSIRNEKTHKLAKTVASLYKQLNEQFRKEEAVAKRILGREFLIGTKYSFEQPAKVSYYIYVEKKKVEFYFIVPRKYYSVIKEKMTDVWSNLTVEQVAELPSFGPSATKHQLVYTKEDGLSLATNRSNNDLLHSTLNIIDVMEEGDRAAVFYNFMPTNQNTFKPRYRNTIDRVKKGLPVDRNKLGLGYALKLALGSLFYIADSISDALGELDGKKKPQKDSMFEALLQQMNGAKKYEESTRKKATATIIDTQILVMSESADRLRERNNAKSLAQSFDTISDDNRLEHRAYKGEFKPTDYRIKGAEVNKVGDEEAQNFLALPGRSILENYGFIDKVDTTETDVPEELRTGVMRIGESIYRGMKRPAYLSTDSEFKYLSLILIGPNRAGKSTLIGNLSYDAIKADECVIMFDYIGNCELSDEVAELFPPEKRLFIECDNQETLQGLGYNEVGVTDEEFTQYDNAKKQTTQLMTLVNSINTSDTHLSPKMERYLTSASTVVFMQGGAIRDVFQVLQSVVKRYKFLKGLPSIKDEDIRESVEECIESLMELDDVDKDGNLKGTKLNLIVGIIDRLNKLKANTFMELMLKKDCTYNINLVDEMQKPQLICIKMPEHMFTTDNEKDVYATYWITKLWMALQIRKQKFKNNRDAMTKCNLVIDELYQVENTEKFLTSKLSRLPKFNIKPIISCHYLNQIKHIREELRSASASYLLIAGCDKQNFAEFKEELRPFELDDLLALKRFHAMSLIKTKSGYAKMITALPKPVNKIVDNFVLSSEKDTQVSETYAYNEV
jgi:hypothetical protein